MTASGRKNADPQLALGLAAGKTLAAAALDAGVSERTASRRMKNPEFRQQVRELRAEMVERASGQLADGMVEAALTLRLLMRSKNEMVKLSAARSLLEYGMKVRETVDFERQIAELENPKEKGTE